MQKSDRSRRPQSDRSRRQQPQTRRTAPAPDKDAALSEFSDEYNDFYVDEVGKRRERAAAERPKEQKTRKRSPRKPVSPMRRKLTRIISYLVIITVVLVVGVILSLTVLFKTQSYVVEGNTKYNEADIIATCGITEGENIFLAPKHPAEERVLKTYPYVEAVKVGFQIPDTIKIDITEAVEGYLVKVTDTEYLLISTKGRILARVADKSAYDLPIFIGPKLLSGEPGEYVRYEDETIVAIIDNITTTFADNGYQGITEIDATDTASITFTYEGRIKVKLGIPEDIDYKIRTAMTIITENIDINPSSKLQGELDVSRCNITKRSYFNERELIDINATEAPTEQPTDAEGNPDNSDSGTTVYGFVNGTDWDGDGVLDYDYDGDGLGDYDWDGDGVIDYYSAQYSGGGSDYTADGYVDEQSDYQ